MAREFRLPDIGEGLTEAEVVRWLVPVGGTVAMDEPVVEVETDKAVVEIPCPFAGIVLHHGAGEGEVVSVGEILVVVGEEGESWPPPSDEESGQAAAPIVGTISSEVEDLVADGDGGRPAAGGGRVQALPVVRKLARELGVDLESIEGTGPQGRITREDVLRAAEAPAAAGTAEPSQPAHQPLRVEVSPEVSPAGEPAPTPASRRPGEGARVSLSRTRRTIAANMSRSWSEIPHVTTFDEVDAARLLAARRALEERHHRRIPLDALLVKAVIPALERHPEMAARLEGDELVLASSHDIGIAVDTEDGLLVAVLRDAGSRGLLDLAAEVERLATQAKERRLPPSDLTGQVFTVSNIGAVGGGHGTPIVPPGTVGILSVGRAVEKPVARAGRVEVAPVMPLSLSYDHRVIDGAVGRRFIALVLENLEEPALFLAG